MAFTWTGSSGLTFTDITTTPANKILAFLNTAITANSGNAAFKWQVATYQSTSPAYLMLSRKAGTAGRILIFGQSGSTCNAAACYPTPGAGELYISYSASSTSNTITTSYLTGVPLADSDYMRGMPIAGNLIGNSTRTDYRLIYYDTDAGLVLGISTITGAIFQVHFAGELMLDLSNNPLSCCSGMDTSLAISAWVSSTSDSQTVIAKVAGGANATYATTLMLIARIGGVNYQLYRTTILASTAVPINGMFDAPSGRLWFIPIPLGAPSDVTSLGQVGHMRQMAFGPNALRDAVYIDASTGLPGAYPITWNTTATNEALWLINEDI